MLVSNGSGLVETAEVYLLHFVACSRDCLHISHSPHTLLFVELFVLVFPQQLIPLVDIETKSSELPLQCIVPLVVECVPKVSHLHFNYLEQTVHEFWHPSQIPSHTGIRGNEKSNLTAADCMAAITTFSVPLLAGGDESECVTCQCPLTVKHILIECTDFRDIRNKYFVPSTMKDVFEQVSMRNVINFIKETHFYNLL